MNRHALVIGIDKYPLLRTTDTSGRIVESHDLQGCVNDAESFAQLLQLRFLFPAERVHLLRNESATRDRILGELDRLAQIVESEDVAVVFFAGHGSQMMDREGTKFDPLLDDTLVPHDSGRGKHPSRDITDDEIRVWLLKIAATTPHIILIFDCCHSATMHRTFGNITRSERGLPPDTRSISELPPSPIPIEHRALLASRTDWLPPEQRYVYLSACLAKETAREVCTIDGTQLVHHGAFSSALLQAMAQAPVGATYRDVFEQAAFEVTKTIPNQHPQAEGALHSTLFDAEQAPLLSYVLVSGVSGSRVTIAAGKPSGVVVNSEWILFPPGCTELTDRNEVPARPRIRIVSSTSSSAEGVLQGTASMVSPLWRAVLVASPVEIRWPVRIQGPGVPPPSTLVQSTINSRDPVLALYGSITGSPWLRIATEAEPPMLTVQLIPSRRNVSAESSIPQLGPIPFESWVIIDASGEVRASPIRTLQTQLLLQNLEKLVRHRFVAGLRNPSSRLCSKVDFNLLRKNSDGSEAPLHDKPTSLPNTSVGTRLVVTLHNRTREELYVALLQLDASSSVKQIYPPSGTSAPLGAQGHGRIGDGEGRPLVVEFPPDLPVNSQGDPPTEAILEIMLFVSAKPVDLHPLFQEAVRTAQPGLSGAAPLRQLLTASFSGRANLRAFVVPAAPLDEWTTDSRALVVVNPRSNGPIPL